jgi:hypothetical protein
MVMSTAAPAGRKYPINRILERHVGPALCVEAAMNPIDNRASCPPTELIMMFDCDESMASE